MITIYRFYLKELDLVQDKDVDRSNQNNSGRIEDEKLTRH